MRLIGKTTVEDYFKREFHGLVAQNLTSESQYRAGVDKINTFLRKQDGDIYEFVDVTQFKTVSGLCVVNPAGDVLAKVALK